MSGGGGQPIMRKLEEDILREAEANGMGPEEWVCSLIAGGESVRDVMARYGRSRTFFYTWVKVGGPARMEAYQGARRASAEAKEDEGEEVLREAAEQEDLSGPHASIASSRANYSKWQAEVRDPAQFGKRQQIGLEVSVGRLHLDSLRRARVDALKPAVVEAVVEAVLVEDDADGLEASLAGPGPEDELSELLEG